LLENDLNPNKKVRCAIYTRKSHEEGLEQEFNSLDAQRVAAENYIASQVAQGWITLPKYYDDGGYSGGTLERPALRRLLDDIKEGEVDCIVVYKIDRLTRSLLDFSQLVQVFDANNVSFVSVTQSFNTSNSMGKLMLNVLLSFAQYERELTGERIRDKFESSKKKGMWMGGNLPLGYDLGNRKLILNEKEAETIKLIYDHFLKYHSITETVRYLNKSEFTTKSWVTAKGKVHEGKKFNKNAIEKILKNPLYIGKTVHKDKIYDGQHPAIIDEETYQKVQDIFKIRSKEKINLPNSRITSPPLLKGLINCGICGCKMSSTYAVSKGKKYRYYICSNKTRRLEDDCEIGRISANETEKLAKEQILQLLKKPEIIVHTISNKTKEISENEIINYFQNIEKLWDELFPVEQARIINLLIEKVTINENGMDLRIIKDGLNSLANEVTVN